LTTIQPSNPTTHQTKPLYQSIELKTRQLQSLYTQKIRNQKVEENIRIFFKKIREIFQLYLCRFSA